MHNIDTLVHASWVIPVEPAGRVLAGHSVAIERGRIVAVLPSDEARRRYHADRDVALDGHALIPGLVNAHTHAAMTLFRGVADDLPLKQWLTEHIWPAEQRWVSDALVRDGTRLACAEMLRGGVTCFNDMYFYPDEAGRVAGECGMRATVGLIVVDFPTVWARDTDEYLAKATEVHDRFRDDPLVRTAFTPHAPYSVSDAAFERVRTLADELDVPVHVHVHETAEEIADSVRACGERPLARLDRLGILSHRLMAVHMIHLEDAEIARIAECAASVVHCPESNLKLANGFCPVERLRRAGINVALGTDGAASNNDLDLHGEMRTAALLAKGVASDAAALPAAAALELATLGGARALGLEEEIGTLEAGKSADVVAVDLGAIETQPVHDPLSHVVYAAGRAQVSDVWIAGRRVLERRTLTTLDCESIAAEAEQWRRRMAGGTHARS
ncbi:MAG: TRZ/ATZ family hydrolase [Gammaproteobacteria bacterium]|nr:TRZ/ATZ family hydrolase [Gammaproteobacteria bacterium]